MRKWRTPFHYTLDFGSIGQGLATAIGVAFADPARSTVLVEGDGSLMMHLQELETAARYDVRLLVVVLDDRALGAEYHKLAARGLDPTLGLMPATDLAPVARSLGCRAATVTSLEQLAPAVDEFVSGRGPMLIDALTSKSVISVPYWRTQYGRD
jgi:thiamine pyrophosphate-dependent acetolactate synthase large subunit-like protein